MIFNAYSPRSILAAQIVFALLAGFFLATGMGDKALSQDAAQYISGAMNLQAGDGFSTDVFKYDSQYAAGSMPAPQTIWPPGLSILIAAGQPLTQSYERTILWMNFFALCLILILTFRISRLAEVSFGLSLAMASYILFCMHFWQTANTGSATIPMIAACLGMFHMIAQNSNNISENAYRRRLFGASCVGSIALLLHLSSLFFLAGVGLSYVALIGRQGIRKVIIRLTCLFSLPVLVVSVLFVRSAYYTGSFTSRPGGGDTETPVSALRLLLGVAGSISGIGIQDLMDLRWTSWVGLAGLLSIVVAAAASLLRQRFRQHAASSSSRKILAMASSCIVIVVVIHVMLSVFSNSYFLLSRYFLICIPLGVLCLGTLLAPTANESNFTRIVATISIVALVTPQLNNSFRHAGFNSPYEQYPVIMSMLDEEVCGLSLSEMLATEIDRSNPLLINSGQLFWLRSKVPILSIPHEDHTGRAWAAEEVRRKIDQFGVRYVLLSSRLSPSPHGDSQQESFLKQIAVGSIPTWLTPIHSDENFILLGTSLRRPTFSSGDDLGC